MKDCYEAFPSGEHPVMLRVEVEVLWAFPFIHLLHVDHAGDHLTVTFTTHDVKLRGKSLAILFQEIARQRIAALRVGESSDGVVIEAIEVKEGGEP